MQPVEQREHAGELILGQSDRACSTAMFACRSLPLRAQKPVVSSGRRSDGTNCVRERPQNRAVSMGDRRLIGGRLTQQLAQHASAALRPLRGTR
jgi:hypothetical protein